jgi:hypothetical protein
MVDVKGTEWEQQNVLMFYRIEYGKQGTGRNSKKRNQQRSSLKLLNNKLSGKNITYMNSHLHTCAFQMSTFKCRLYGVHRDGS